jgi:two-component system alkaline phosphatase synthesis response regulator PhoP
VPKILIADDDEDILTVMRHVFESSGYDVAVARDGRAAVEVALDFRPDVMLLDIMMPETHGLSVCRQIKTHADLSKTKVVILSCKAFPADQRQAKEVGADAFYAKPVDNQFLIDEVHRLLQR